MPRHNGQAAVRHGARVGWHVEHLDTCSSTMDEARDRAHEGAPDGTVVIAQRMTGGRGRHGHTWHAPEGGLYLSMVLRDIPAPDLLTLALGNAVADVLEVAGAEPRLKWVNDIYIDGRKVGGVLVEAESTGDHMDFFVAGVGINFNGTTSDWPADLAGIATTLEESLGADTCIEDTEPFVLDAVAKWLKKVREGRDAEILDAYRARDALKGHRVRVDGTEGTAEGIDGQGRLVVDGTPLEAGTVEVLDGPLT